MKITDLKIGESGILQTLPSNFPISLMELGFLPNVTIKLLHIAPLNDPIYLIVNDTYLAIRKEPINNIKITI